MGLTLFLRMKFPTMWVILLIVVTVGAQRPVTTMPWNIFPATVIDHMLVDPPSTCICKVMCALNSSCTAVSLYVNGGSVTCSFSNVAIDLASLSFSVNDHTFIYNVSQPTAGSTSLLGTDAYTTPTSATSASGALTYATLASATSASATPASTSETSATNASTSETSATNALTSETSATNASTSQTSATNASASETSATNAFTSEITATNTNTTLALNTTITPTSNSSITSNTTFITSTSVNWTTSATTTPTVTNCNTKYWTVFSGSCYSQFSYMYKSWAEARGTCAYYSSSLLQITSPEELSFIANTFSSSASWIALKKDSTGTFRWDADNSESAISNWGTGEPGSGDCVNMSNGKWKTSNCGNYLGFFCKKPAY